MGNALTVSILILIVILIFIWSVFAFMRTKFYQTAMPKLTNTPKEICGKKNEKLIKEEGSFANIQHYLNNIGDTTNCDSNYITVLLNIVPDSQVVVDNKSNVVSHNSSTDAEQIPDKSPSIKLAVQWNPPISNLLSMDLKIKAENKNYTVRCKLWLHDYEDKDRIQLAIKSILTVLLTNVYPLQQIFPDWQNKVHSPCTGLELLSAHIDINSDSHLCNHDSKSCTFNSMNIVDFMFYLKLILKDIYHAYKESNFYSNINVNNIPKSPDMLFYDINKT